MKIAVIPARGGSKRIPRKNIKLFHGKPMIAWSILAAQKSQLFDHIIVSTDDAEIASVAKQWGGEVPFMRPDSLSDDYAGTTAVIAHAVEWMLEQGWSIHAVCCIYATAPFIQADDLIKGLEILESGSWSYTFAVTNFAYPIFRAFQLSDEGGIAMFFPEHFSSRSQDLPEAWHDAGQFYWGRPVAWLENIMVFSQFSAPVLIPRWRVQDIDNEEDWNRAQIIASMILDK